MQIFFSGKTKWIKLCCLVLVTLNMMQYNILIYKDIRVLLSNSRISLETMMIFLLLIQDSFLKPQFVPLKLSRIELKDANVKSEIKRKSASLNIFEALTLQ